MNTNHKFKHISTILLLSLMLIVLFSSAVFAEGKDKNAVTDDSNNAPKEETVIITVDGKNTVAESGTAETQSEEEPTEEDVTLSSVDIQPPTAPYNLRIDMVTETTITVEWSPSLDNQGVFEYKIYKNYEEIGTSNSTSYLLTDMNTEDNFVLTVRAVDYSGNISDSSNILCIYHTSGGDVSGITIAAPTGLEINRVWDNKLTLVWQSSESAADISYEIYNGNSLVGTTSQKQYVVTGLQNGSSYSFKVRAKNLDGFVSDFCSTVSYTYDSSYVTVPPVAPQNLRIDSVSQNAVTLRWVGNAVNVLEYVVYDEDRIMGKTSANSYTVTGLVNEDTYIFTARAKAYDGTLSDASNTVLLYHINGDVQNPLNVTVQAKADNASVTVTGSALANNTVTMAVRNIENSTIFTASTACGTDGGYKFNFTMPENSTEGVYTVTVEGEGSLTPAVTTFKYVEANISGLSVNIVSNNTLTVSGSTTVGEGKRVSLNITRQGETLPLFANDITVSTGADGSFVFEPITMPEGAAYGLYTAVVTCEGISAPIAKAFSYEPTTNIDIVSVKVTGTIVTVNGVTGAGAGKAVTILVRDKNNKIAYVNQDESGNDAGFAFTFTMPDAAIDGEYTIRIGGEDISVPAITTFFYGTQTFETEYARFDGNVVIQNYITTITGTASCKNDGKLTMLIKDQNQNTVYLNETIVEADGEQTISCTLPSLLNSGSYTAEIKSYEVTESGETIITSASVNINTSLLTVGASGTAYCQEGKRIAVTAKETENNLIDKTFNFTGSDTKSITVPTFLCAGTIDVDAVFYKLKKAALITADTSLNGSTVVVNGNISSGTNKTVTISVKNSNDSVIYESQTTSGTGGSYSFAFTMPDDAADGEYTVTLGGTDVKTPATITFIYRKSIGITVNVNGRVVTVAGTTGFEADKALSLNIVKKGSTIPLFTTAVTTVTVSDGSFAFAPITIPDGASVGEYIVQITPEGAETPVTKPFWLTDNGAITADINVCDNAITVNGLTAAGADKAVTILVRDANSRIVYVNQGESSTGGSFVFAITMPDDAISGEYTVTVGGEDILTPGTFKFTYDSQLLLTANVVVGTDQVTVTGTTAVGADKTATLNVTRQGENTSLLTKTAVTSTGGSYTFTILASELPSNGEYTVTVSMEGVQTTVTKNFVYPQTVSNALTAPVILPPQSGDVTDTMIKLNWYPAQSGTGTITYSVYVNGILYAENLSSTNYEILYLLPQTSYNIKVIALDAAGNVAVSNVLSVSTREFQNQNSIHLNCAADKQFNLILVGKNIEGVKNKEFTIKYDPQILEVVDLCALTKEYDTDVEVNARIVGTDILITEFDRQNGIIRLIFDKDFNGEQWTGLINIICFRSLNECIATTIEYDVE